MLGGRYRERRRHHCASSPGISRRGLRQACGKARHGIGIGVLTGCRSRAIDEGKFPGIAASGESASRKWLGFALAIFLTAAVSFILHATPAPQTASEQTDGEIVATLATGHVVWCVTSDAILVAATRRRRRTGLAPARHPPDQFVSSRRSARRVDWNQGSVGKRVRLDAELPQVASNATRRPAPAQKDLSTSQRSERHRADRRRRARDAAPARQPAPPQT